MQVKSWRISVFTLAMSFLLLVPSFADIDEIDELHSQLSGKVKVVEEKGYGYSFHFGKWIQNEQTMRASKLIYTPGGLLTDYYIYSTDGSVVNKWTFIYDKNDRLQKVNRYNVQGLIENYELYTYDTLGKLITIDCFNASDICIFKTQFAYDTKGRILERKKSDPSNTLSYKYLYTYEKDGSYNKTCLYYDITKQKLTDKIVYMYDAKEHNTGMIYYSVDDDAIDSRVSIIYDTLGNKIQKSIFNSDGWCEEKITFVYDSSNNVVEENWYNQDGTIKCKNKYKYVYDNNGNWTKKLFSQTTPQFEVDEEQLWEQDEKTITYQ